jgi:hypothetical protein
MRRTMLFMAVALVAAPLAAQTTSELERVAALRFALANGFVLPEGTVVARETVVDSSRPRPQATRLQFRSADASALAEVVTPVARVVSSVGLVSCRQRVCWSLTSVPVLVASDPETTSSQEKTVVGLQLYSRQGDETMLTSAVVVIEQINGGWRGLSYSVGPFSRRVTPPSQSQPEPPTK